MRQRSRLFITRDTAAVLLIVMLWCRAVGSQIVLSLSADKVFVPIGHEPIWTPAANVTSKLFYLLAVAISLGVILFRINDVTRPGLWRIAVVLAPWLCIVTHDLYSGRPTPDSVLYAAVVLALAALRPNPRMLAAVGVLVVLTAIIAIALGFLVPDAGILREATGAVSERSDKAVFPSLGLLQGMFTSENNLGQYLAIGTVGVVMQRRRWLRLSGLGIVLFAILWSSSRSSIVAIACMLGVGSVVWIFVELGWRRTASAAARVATGSALLTMCVLPFMGWKDDAFTGRALIWKGSLAEWASKGFLSGLGHDWYEHISESQLSPLNAAAYHGHNQFVQFLATGGVMLAFFGVGSLVVQTYAITRPTNRYLVIAAMLVTAIAVSGFFEVPVGFMDRSAFWTVTIVPLTVLFFARAGDIDQESGARCPASG